MSKLDELIKELCPDGVPFKRLSEVCDISRGRVMSKEYLRDNAGEYPVYSSQTANEGIFGYINTFDYDCESVTWTTDELIRRYGVKTLEFAFEPTMKNRVEFSTKKIVKVSPVDDAEEQKTTCDSKMSKVVFLKKYLPVDTDNQTLFYCSRPADTNKFARGYASNCLPNYIPL